MAARTRPKTVHLSVRIPESLAEDLDDLAARLKITRSQAAIRVLEEGSRMARFPGIDFRTRAMGCRSPFITGTGLGVWEFFMLFTDYGGNLKRILRYHPNITEGRAQAALRYIEVHRDEIEEELELSTRPPSMR